MTVAAELRTARCSYFNDMTKLTSYAMVTTHDQNDQQQIYIYIYSPWKEIQYKNDWIK